MKRLRKGADIKRLRKAAGITQKQLSDYLGIAEITVRKWEKNNELNIKPFHQEKLSNLEKQETKSIIRNNSNIKVITSGKIAKSLIGSPFLAITGGILGAYASQIEKDSEEE